MSQIGALQGGSSHLYAHQAALSAADTAASQARAALSRADAAKEVVMPVGLVGLVNVRA